MLDELLANKFASLFFGFSAKDWLEEKYSENCK